MMRWLGAMLAALGTCTSGMPGRAPDGTDKSRPNIVFILADDLGWTDLGCQGSRYYETPVLDRMASEGLRFTSAYSCGPNCQPTRAALLTGQYGPRTGVYTVGSIDRFDWRSRPLQPIANVQKLPLDRATFADSLKKAGYATGMFGKWHLGEQGNHHPQKRGFDEAIVSMGQHFNFRTNPSTPHPRDIHLADFLTNRAEDFLRRHRDQPFFLMVSHFSVHSPHESRADLKRRFDNKPGEGGHRNPTYAGMIAGVDESVGRILKKLRDLNLEGNTLVIFSSDNGGVGGYRREGLQGASDITDNAPLRHGKGSLYEGGIRVPFLARWPGKIPPGLCDAPIASIDLFPTLLELAEARKPASQVLDGRSLVATFTSGGKIAPDRDALYWHFPGYLGSGAGWRTTPVGAIRSGDWKLLQYFETGKLELYDLRNDLSEKNNLAERMPDRARELRDRLVAWRKEVGARMPGPNPGARKK